MSFYLRDTADVVAARCITDPDTGVRNGLAQVRGPYRTLTIFFSDGAGWEHVSVSTPGRCPNWAEMCFVKNLFWDPEAVVMQLHPAASEHVNVHPNCLHLWRPTAAGVVIPTPPRVLVG